MSLTPAERKELQRLLDKAYDPETGVCVLDPATGHTCDAWSLPTGFFCNESQDSGSVDGMKTVLPAFPAGIKDVETWGKTLMLSGVLAHFEMTYLEIARSPEDRMKKYAKWCRSRADSSTGQAKDFGNYLIHYYSHEKVDSGLLIPGTNQKRYVKP